MFIEASFTRFCPANQGRASEKLGRDALEATVENGGKCLDQGWSGV
jgi:hypothetical protein